MDIQEADRRLEQLLDDAKVHEKMHRLSNLYFQRNKKSDWCRFWNWLKRFFGQK